MNIKAIIMLAYGFGVISTVEPDQGVRRGPGGPPYWLPVVEPIGDVPVPGWPFWPG